MHDHRHHHAPPGIDPRWALGGSLLLNGSFFIAELAVGLWSGSLALLSDAGHMLSDVGALILALAAAVIARRPTSPKRTFGWARVEVLGGFVNGLTQLLVVGWIAVEALGRMLGPTPDVPGLPVLIVGAVGLLINLGSVFLLLRSDRESLNIRGALLHMTADALGSVGAMIAAGLMLWGYPSADAIISVIIAGLILVGTIRLLRDSGKVLLQLPPDHVDVAEVRRALIQLGGVRDVHDLHVWTLDGRAPVLSAHLVVANEAQHDDIRAEAVAVLAARFDVRHATLQVEIFTEEGGVPCGIAPCEANGGLPMAPAHAHTHHHHGH